MKVTRKVIHFVTTDESVVIHDDLIRRYGGGHGLLNASLLDSAMHQPQAAFGGEYLLSFPFEMAGTYLLSLALNHPFIDGNKRTAWVVSQVFLRMNGYILKPRKKAVLALMNDVVIGKTRDVGLVATQLQQMLR